MFASDRLKRRYRVWAESRTGIRALAVCDRGNQIALKADAQLLLKL
jgi:hypothetical protein